MSNGERRLAAVMFTDIVGYTSLAQRDESSTLQALERNRSLLRPLFASHGGREIKTMGDAFLIEFQSALDAVLCAVAVQQMMHDRRVARGEPLLLRIGIHVGDVVASGNDILGDTVNIASRVEGLAEQGGVCVTSQVYEQVRNKSDLPFVSLGEKALKNVTTPVEAYKVVMPWERSGATETDTYPANRIAILPFANMSPDPSDEYFADGITDEIITTVSGISGLSVISRTSAMVYKGAAKRLGEIGKELGVGSILEGSFKKAGNKIRVTAQLIDVAGDRHVWAQNYDRNLDDVFAVQSDVAKQVADALRVEILPRERERIERKPTESTEAYSLYLKGRHLWNRRMPDDVKKALEYFGLAIHEDPTFALGYVGEADCCLILRNNWSLDLQENLEKAKSMASRALELDPGLAEAHATKGLALRSEYNLQEAEAEFKRAIELKPSYATAHQWYHLVLLSQTRWDEALEQVEKALELDPLSPQINLNLGQYFITKREYAKAIDPCKKSLDLGLGYAHGWLSATYGFLKMYDDMEREAMANQEMLKVAFPLPLARVSHDLSAAWFHGDKQTVKRLLHEVEARYQDAGWDAESVASMHFYLGESDKGFEWLERSYSDKEDSLLSIKTDVNLDGVRTDPRYVDFLKRLGLD